MKYSEESNSINSKYSLKSSILKRNFSKKQYFTFAALILDIFFMTLISLGYKNGNMIFFNEGNSIVKGEETAQMTIDYVSNNSHFNVLEADDDIFNLENTSNIDVSAFDSNNAQQELVVEKEVSTPMERIEATDFIKRNYLPAEGVSSILGEINTEFLGYENSAENENNAENENYVVNKSFYSDYVEPFLSQDTLSCFHSRLEINRSKAYPFGINTENQTIGHSIQVIDGVTYIDGILIVNKTYCLPETYNPGSLYPEVLSSFDEMKNDARSAGLNIYIASGFRSYSRQIYLYNHYVNRDGQVQAERFSARPGHSEHQSGYSFDLNTITDKQGTSKESIWVAEHAHEYGFIVRFPAGKEELTGYLYEPWHLRYVGIELATYLYENDLCLEEYFDITSEYEN